MSAAGIIARMLIGDSVAMREVRQLIVTVAAVREPVLVQGPTGTGKELVVQALHLLSGRSGRLTAVNTPAIPESTFEATLFGHTRGAFTGAVVDLPGLLHEARGGTLFLDEIGAFPLALQPKLLRVTETMCYRPIGGSKDIQGDFRLVSAANDDLEARVLEGSFRPDLLERIATVRIIVPSLRERIQDVPQLLDHFVSEGAREGHARVAFSPGAIEFLMEYHWPRNVRQLRNFVRRATLLGEQVVTRRHVDILLASNGSPQAVNRGDDKERARLVALLEAADWNVDLVARQLAVGKSTLYGTMKHHGIRRPTAVGRRLAGGHGTASSDDGPVRRNGDAPAPAGA